MSNARPDCRWKKRYTSTSLTRRCVMKGVTGTVNLTVTANATTTIILTDTIPHGLHFIADSAPPGTIYKFSDPKFSL